MVDPLASRTSPLLTDLYQLNMLQAYVDEGLTDVAVFEFFVRRLPKTRNFLIAAGLEPALEFLETLSFVPEELDWLARSRRFRPEFMDWLAGFRFTGDVEAMPEGTAFFPHEPILRVTAPLPQAQFVETRLVNLLHYQTLVASKAARMVLAVPTKTLVDFGLRRAHGGEAGLYAARAAFIAGFAGSATVLAEARFGVPAFGTMAHSFIQAHAGEREAFRAFARSRPTNLVLLIDTYDTESGAAKVAELAPELAAAGSAVKAVRIDSGDLGDHARRVRHILDEAGLTEVAIFASGGLDEHALAALATTAIDGFGVGTALTVSDDAPALDCAYKMQEYAGLARRKRSEGKVTWPGRKQVWRRLGNDGRMTGDVLSLEGDTVDGAPLLRPAMRGGRRVEPPEGLAAMRSRTARNLARLPDPLRSLAPSPPYPLVVGNSLRELAREVDRNIERGSAL